MAALRSVASDRAEQRDATATTRLRPATAVLTEMSTRIRALGIALVPASAWDVLYLTLGVKRDAPIGSIARLLNVKADELCYMIGLVTCELGGKGDHYWTAADVLAALRLVKEGRRG